MNPETIASFLERHKGCRIAIASHQKPDGDALGSCIGLAGVLRHAGYDATVIAPSPFPVNLRFIADPEVMIERPVQNWWRDFGCFGVLDCGDAGRLDEINQPAAATLPTFNIDHHISSKGVGQAAWLDGAASSTGEMVVRLCRAAGWTIPSKAAQALWVAIVTDTGRFSYENTSPDSMAAARECLLAGANPAEAATRIYQSVGVPERVLQTKVLERMEFHEKGRLALSWLARQDFFDAGIGTEGTQDLINLLRDTAGVEVSVLLYEPPAKIPDTTTPIKASLRSIAPHDCLAIAKVFGGGGHQRAAGCTLTVPLFEAKRQLLAAAANVYFGESRQPTAAASPDPVQKT